MQWDDFRKLIHDNILPWRTMKYYRDKNGFKDTVSICDFTLPERGKHINTAEGAAKDWYRDSFVCNAGWLGGAIPVRSNPAIYNDEAKKWEKWPVRGAQDTMKLLVKQKVVGRTPAITEFMRTGYWRF